METFEETSKQNVSKQNVSKMFPQQCFLVCPGLYVFSLKYSAVAKRGIISYSTTATVTINQLDAFIPPH